MDELKIDKLPDGSMLVELPTDLSGWLKQNAGYAEITLGETKGCLLVLPGADPAVSGPMFMWSSDNGKGGKRTDILPWADAVKRFGPPNAA